MNAAAKMKHKKLFKTLQVLLFTSIVFISADAVHANTDLTGIQVTNACAGLGASGCSSPGDFSVNWFSVGSGTSAIIGNGVEFISSNISPMPGYPFFIQADFFADTLRISYQFNGVSFGASQLIFDLNLPQGLSLANVVLTSNTLALDSAPVTVLGDEIRINVAAQDASSPNLTADFQIQTVPIPATAWLFSSGLVGLTGLARQRKNVTMASR